MRISDWSSDVCSSDLHSDTYCLFHGYFLSIEPGCPPVDGERQDGDGKAQPQHRLGGPSRLWTSAVGTVFTGRFRLEIDMPEAVAEQRGRYAKSEERRVGKEGVRTCSTGW